MPRKQKAGVLIIGALVVAGCTTSQHKSTSKNSARWAPVSEDVLARAKTAKRPKVLPETHFAAGRLFEGRGLYDKAIVQYRKAVAVNHSYAAAHHRLGLLLSMVGQRDEALNHLMRAVKLEPKNAIFRNNLGFEHLLAKRWEESIEHFEQATRIAPRFARAHVNLGMALSRVGRFEEAYASFSAVLPEADAHYNMGLMLRGQGRHSQAIDAFITVLAIDPEFRAAKAQLVELRAERRTHVDNTQEPALTLTGFDARVIQNAAPTRPVIAVRAQKLRKAAPATPGNTETKANSDDTPKPRVNKRILPKATSFPRRDSRPDRRRDPHTRVDTPNAAIRLADTQNKLEDKRDRSAHHVQTVDAVARIDAPFFDEFAADQQTTSPVDQSSQPAEMPPPVCPTETFRIIPILAADFDGIFEDFIDEWNVEESDCDETDIMAGATASTDVEDVFDETQAASVTELIKTLRAEAAQTAEAEVDSSEAELVTYAPVETEDQTPLLVDLAEPVILEQLIVVDLGISTVASVPDEIWFATEELIEEPCEEYLALDPTVVLDNAGFESEANEPVIDLNTDPDLLALARILDVAEFDPLLDTLALLETPDSPRLTDPTPHDTVLPYDDWDTLFVERPVSDVGVQVPMSIADPVEQVELATPVEYLPNLPVATRVEDAVAIEMVATIDPQAMQREITADLATVREQIACLEEIDTSQRVAFALPTRREVSDTELRVLAVGPGPLYPTLIAGPMGPPFDAATTPIVKTRTRFTTQREAAATSPRRARLMSKKEEVIEDQSAVKQISEKSDITERERSKSRSVDARPFSWIGSAQQLEPLFAFAEERAMSWEQLVRQTQPEPPLDTWLLELFDLHPETLSDGPHQPTADVIDSHHKPFGDIVPVKYPATHHSDLRPRHSRRKARSGPE